MTGTVVFAPGGYRYIPAVFQYSAGVAAEDGFELERARFMRPVPLAEAFAASRSALKAIGRPLTAFAQCELRSPAPFTDQGFIDFNKQYVHTLERWGIYKDGVNPVARTNVCPMYNEPAEPSMLAFTYTVPAATPRAAPSCCPAAATPGDGSQPYQRAHRALRRHLARRPAREGGLRHRGDGAAAQGARLRLAGCGQHAGLHRAEHRPSGRRRTGAARRDRQAAWCGTTRGRRSIGLEYEMDVRGTARELIL